MKKSTKTVWGIVAVLAFMTLLALVFLYGYGTATAEAVKDEFQG